MQMGTLFTSDGMECPYCQNDLVEVTLTEGETEVIRWLCPLCDEWEDEE